MIALLGAAFMLAQSATPPVLPPEWAPAALAEGEYAHYVRQGSERVSDQLHASLRVCDCRPGDVADQLSAPLGALDGAAVKRSDATVCGEPAVHLVVTGIAGSGRTNIDLYLLRKSEALALLELTFSEDAPSAQDDAALRTLCPPVPALAPSPTASA